MKVAPIAIRQLADVRSGAGAPQDQDSFSQIGHPFVRAGSLAKLLDGAREDSLEHIESDVAKEHRLELFPAGTVLFAKSGMSATKGHIYCLKAPAYVVSHLSALVPHEPSDSQFLVHALRRFPPTVLIKDAAYPSIRLADIEGMKILAPSSLQERRRIAEVLDRAEALRAKRRAAIAQLDTLTQAIFLDMFGDPVANHKGWEVSNLSDVATKITDGTHKTPTYTESGVPFLSAKDLKEGRIDWNTGKHISRDEHLDLIRRCKAEQGDVLLAKSGSLGTVAIVDRGGEFSLFESLCLIKQRRDLIEGTYLVHALRCPTMQALLLRKNKGIAVKHLHLVDIRDTEIPIPPLHQQHEFGQRVAAIEHLIQMGRTSLSALEGLFGSLQSRAFSGEL